MKWIAAVLGLLGLAAIALGLRNCGDKRIDPPVTTVVDTMENADLHKRLAEQSKDLEIFARDNKGLRGTVQQLRDRIRGLEARKPDTTYIAADPVDVSGDTLMRPGVAIDKAGFLTLPVLIPRTDSLHEERLHAGIDVRDCDDGIVFGAQGAACNAAAFGHLLLFARGGAYTDVRVDAWRSIEQRNIQPVGALGVRWQKCYRCTFTVEAMATTEERVYVWGEYGWRPF